MTVSLFQLQLPVRSEELRRHPRLALRRRAWCEHRDWTLYLPVANVSVAGLFIQTSTPFVTGEPLRVSLAEAGERIVVDVEVVWSSSRGRLPGIGCRFSHMREGAEHYARLLDNLCLNAR